jgi:GT2 family glycosyltransferase
MIYLIVPTFGRVDNTKSLIKSLADSIIKKDYLTLIVDSHPDKIIFRNVSNFPHTKVLVPDGEMWWVESINYGIEILLKEYTLSETDVVIFANNDVVINQNCFELLYSELQKNKMQILHPRTFDQNNIEVSSGTKILSFFPYVTTHPKDFLAYKSQIDMGTGRFLMMSASTLNSVKYINTDLVQYLGDNDFTLTANRRFGIKTYILKDAICKLDDTHTGIKNDNIRAVKDLFLSFFSIKSPNNIKYRYIFFKKHFNAFYSIFITFSMTVNSILKFLIRKVLP